MAGSTKPQPTATTTHHQTGALFEKTPSGIPTEENFNTGSSLEHNPYPYSKGVAEREAWKINPAPSQRGLFQMARMEELSACGQSARLRRLSNRLLMSAFRITCGSLKFSALILLNIS